MALHLWCLFWKSQYLICAPDLLRRLETPDLPVVQLAVCKIRVMYVMMPVPEGFAL